MLSWVMALILFLLAPGGFSWFRDASVGSKSPRDAAAMVADAISWIRPEAYCT
jgi:hypothetical protein